LIAETLNRYAESKLDSLRKSLRFRAIPTVDTLTDGDIRKGSADLLSFASNDYLGLSRHPAVIEAAIRATRRYGVGAGASRLICGNHPLYEELESRLADLKQTEDAVVFGSGYLTNCGVIPALVGPRDLICLDELSHSCMLSGARLARSRLVMFRHNDLDHLSALLSASRSRHRHCLILTEGVFSMEGDRAPLTELSEVAAAHDAWLMTDDAHALGVIGDGRGSSFASGASVPLQMGTLSKAAGSYGGYLCASRSVSDLIRNRARTLIYSTGLPPGSVAAASKALEIIGSDTGLVARPLERARRFTSLCGLPQAESPIVPLVVGDNRRALALSADLENEGFFVPAIRPPTVPAGRARLRFAFAAFHSNSDVEKLAETVMTLMRRR
jgi:8-amino-7-oxononanoate synthase